MSAHEDPLLLKAALDVAEAALKLREREREYRRAQLTLSRRLAARRIGVAGSRLRDALDRYANAKRLEEQRQQEPAHNGAGRHDLPEARTP
ncbi:MAG: hypothetical protein M3R38_25390 [Actinomycetota bacterium]|nr:hypothetical protein [Actinomycetota bacterium]